MPTPDVPLSACDQVTEPEGEASVTKVPAELAAYSA